MAAGKKKDVGVECKTEDLDDHQVGLPSISAKYIS
jgi:hypothetical protein